MAGKILGSCWEEAQDAGNLELKRIEQQMEQQKGIMKIEDEGNRRLKELRDEEKEGRERISRISDPTDRHDAENRIKTHVEQQTRDIEWETEEAKTKFLEGTKESHGNNFISPGMKFRD